MIGYQFDNAGNTTTDAENRTFVYDGENKQVEVKDVNGISIGKYYYDGDGKRVKKITAQETTVFVYNAGGQLIAEISTKLSETPQVSYLTSDHLRSPRINTNQNGQVTARHDYQPFGEEILRASYGADEIRNQFTTYERDIETDLDFAQARYYKPGHGRFTSVDPIKMKKERTIDPQRINLYVYVRNNPTKFVDPTGEDLVINAKTQAEAEKIFRETLLIFRKSDQGAISLVVGDGKNGYAKGVFAMEFDAKYNTDSKVFNNFRAVSQSNDVVSFGILSPTQTFASRIAQNVGGKVVLVPMNQAYGADNYVSFKDGIAGQTIFPDRGKIIEGLIYTSSGDNTTRVYVANDASQEEIVVTTAHEIGGHVYLSNFGRAIPNGLHAPLDPNFDNQVKEIEEESRQNYLNNTAIPQPKQICMECRHNKIADQDY